MAAELGAVDVVFTTFSSWDFFTLSTFNENIQPFYTLQVPAGCPEITVICTYEGVLK